MAGPLDVLGRTEEEIAALLAVGLTTRRAGRDRLEELAREAASLKLERLAVELRNLASAEDPRALAGSALTAIAMTRKLRERLLPWPELPGGPSLSLASNPTVRLVGGGPTPTPERGRGEGEPIPLPTLAHWLEVGDDLLRAHAAALLVSPGATRRGAGGDEAISELLRLAKAGTVAIRREAITALGRIGGEAALGGLVSLVGDDDCWRALVEAILLFGRAAVPGLVQAANEDVKKGRKSRREMAAALLYRLGADEPLRGLAEDAEEVVHGFALAARARASGRWANPSDSSRGSEHPVRTLAIGIVGLAHAEAAGDPGLLVERLEVLAVNEARDVARWAVGGPLEAPLAEHYLGRLTGGKVKDRQRAASVLRGLACPGIVPRLAALVEREEVDLRAVAGILGETGGSRAVGLLLDLTRRQPPPPEAQTDLGQPATVWVGWGHVDETCKALGHLGDPGAAPALLDALAEMQRGGGRAPGSACSGYVEAALVAFGDGVVDYLAGEMRAREGTPLAAVIQRILLQMRSRRAREALKGIDTDSLESQLSRLGHPKLGSDAAKALARMGDVVLDRLAAVLATHDLSASRDALKALGAMKSPRAYEVVYRLVEETTTSADMATSTLCACAIQALSGFRDERSAPLLARVIAGPLVGQAVYAATQALEKEGSGAVPLLLPLLGHSGTHVRRAAVEVLGRLRAVEAEEKCIELLADGDQGVRMAAITALGHIGAASGTPRAVEALGAVLDQDQGGWWPILQTAISALATTGQPGAILQLRRFAQVAPKRYGNFGGYLRDLALRGVREIEASLAESSPDSAGQGIRGVLRRVLGGS